MMNKKFFNAAMAAGLHGTALAAEGGLPMCQRTIGATQLLTCWCRMVSLKVILMAPLREAVP